MLSREIEEFAKILVSQVRDASIRSCDALLAPQAASPVASRWRATSGGDTIAATIPDIVDEVVFAFLRAVDEGELQLMFRAGNGQIVDLGQEGMGELAGWYMGSGGWRAQSKERFTDDFGDLS